MQNTARSGTSDARAAAACGEHYIAVYSLLFKHVVHADAPVSSEEPPEVRRRRLGKATVALATVALQPIPPDQLTSPSEAGSAPISEQWSPAQKVLAACGVAACTTRCSTSPQAAVDTVH